MFYVQIFLGIHKSHHDMWVPFYVAWCILRLQMEERSPIWSVAMNVLNKLPWTAEKR